jgi:hypothetical protein
VVKRASGKKVFEKVVIIREGVVVLEGNNISGE